MRNYPPRWFLGLILVAICVLGVVRGNGSTPDKTFSNTTIVESGK